MRDALTIQRSDSHETHQLHGTEETGTSNPFGDRRTKGTYSRQLLRLLHDIATPFDNLSTGQRCLLEYYRIWFTSCVRDVPPTNLPRYPQTPRFLNLDFAPSYIVGASPG